MSQDRLTKSASSSGAAPRGALRLLADPVFGTLMWGKLFTASGVWMHIVVAAIVVYQATGSAFMVGMVSVAQFGPQFLLAPISGVLADRGFAAGQIVVGRILCAVGSGSLGLWLWRTDSQGSAEVIAVMAATFVVGVGFAVGGPPLQSIVPALIRPGELPVAMALNTAPLTASVVIGPFVGAYVSGQFTSATAFAIAGIIHTLFALALLALRLPHRLPRPGEDVRSISATRQILHDRGLILLLLVVAGIGFGAETSVTLAPATATALNYDTSLIGAITGSFGAGAAVTLALFTLVVRFVKTAALANSGLWLMATGLTISAALINVQTVLAGFVMVGCGFTLALSAGSALIHERVGHDIRGRVMAVWMMSVLGSRPIAAALEGLVADLVSLRAALVAVVVGMILLAVLTRPSRLAQGIAVSRKGSGSQER